MGINLVWVCHKHKTYHTSMRGEEGIDFQYFVRKEDDDCPQRCLKMGDITVMHDGYFDNHDYAAMMDLPYEDRPARQVEQGRRYGW